MSQFDSTSQELPAAGMEKFLEDNFRKLVWLFVIAVVAIIALGFIRHQNTLKANEAAEAFTGAKTVEDCDLVISRYPGTNAAANALLLKADLLWDQNKKSSSIEALKEFTTKDAKHPLAVFERIVNEFASSEAAPLAQVRLGDLLWAQGKTDEAKKAYEDLAVKFPDMAEYQGISQNRLGWIAAALPTKEVDAPPAPKVEPKPAAANIPGMPNIKLNSANSGIGATIAPGGIPVTVPAATTPAAPAPAADSPPASTPAPAPAMPATPAAPAPEAAPATPVPAAPAPAAASPAPVPAAPPAAAPTPAAPTPAAPAPAAPEPTAPKP